MGHQDKISSSQLDHAGKTSGTQQLDRLDALRAELVASAPSVPQTALNDEIAIPINSHKYPFSSPPLYRDDTHAQLLKLSRTKLKTLQGEAPPFID
jgi:hypothetical protein